MHNEDIFFPCNKLVFNPILMLLIIFMVPSFELYAEESELSPILLFGLTYGGDTLIDVELDDAPDEKIKAGSLVYIGGGLNYQELDQPWSVQLNLAYHFDYTEGDIEDTSLDVEVSFDRFVIELIPYYQFDNNYKVGLGIFKPTYAEFIYDIEDSPDREIEFESNIGLIAEWCYSMTQESWIVLRYAHIEYEAKELQRQSIDGSYFGAFFHWIF